jgi:hypothetical protein
MEHQKLSQVARYALFLIGSLIVGLALMAILGREITGELVVFCVILAALGVSSEALRQRHQRRRGDRSATG